MLDSWDESRKIGKFSVSSSQDPALENLTPDNYEVQVDRPIPTSTVYCASNLKVSNIIGPVTVSESLTVSDIYPKKLGSIHKKINLGYFSNLQTNLVLPWEAMPGLINRSSF